MQLHTIGIDLGKTVFHLVGVNPRGVQRKQLHLSGNLAFLAQPKIFASWLRPLFRKDWIVYSKPPFGSPEYVLHYLGRHTPRGHL